MLVGLSACMPLLTEIPQTAGCLRPAAQGLKVAWTIADESATCMRAQVKIAEHVLTQHKVAIKILNKRKIKQQDMEEKGAPSPK